MNATHGSDSPTSAARELQFFFPNMAGLYRSLHSSLKPRRVSVKSLGLSYFIHKAVDKLGAVLLQGPAT
jgi:hypothetical protein